MKDGVIDMTNAKFLQGSRISEVVGFSGGSLEPTLN